jgi:integrase
MPRKRNLPKYVTPVIDRHGKERFRFRHGGMDFYIAPPGTKEHKETYERALQGFAPAKASTAKPRTVEDLIQRFYRSARFTKGGEKWQATVRSVLEPFREEFRDDKIADFDFEHIEIILGRVVTQQVQENGRKRGGTFAALRLYEQLKRLFAYAVRLKWIVSNPVSEAELPAKHVVKGFHSWTEAEIAKFQQRHPVGSKARLAFEIALWTGLRRADVARLGPRHIVDGRVVTTASKTMKAVNVIAATPLFEAIAATPTGDETFLVTEHGKPFSTAGLGNWFRDRCDEAGLPHCTMHGLRKALTRRAANLRLSQQQLKAIGQWSSDKEVKIYADDADKIELADSAILAVNKWASSSNHSEKVGQNEEISPL